MILILFRHAERESSGIEDPGLSSRGQKQAQDLVELSKKLGAPNKIWVSPKKRAQESFRPLSLAQNLPLQIEKNLNERTPQESSLDFRKRVEHFLSQLSVEQGCIYICTHLDWIEEALLYFDSDVDLLAAQFQNWKTGQYLKLRHDDGVWVYEDFGRVEC